SVLGIAQISTLAGQTVSQNNITGLSNTTTGNVAVSITGLYYDGNPTSGTNVVARNAVQNLSMASASPTSAINGIQLNSGTFAAQNNVVRIGLDASGSTAASSIVRGIYDSGNEATKSFYFNSVYVGGISTGTANTFAIQSANANTRTFQ